MLKYPQAHPEAKKWRSTLFIYYNEFHVLVDGRHATGECAYRVSLVSDNKPDNATSTEDLGDMESDINASQSMETTSQVSGSTTWLHFWLMLSTDYRNQRRLIPGLPP